MRFMERREISAFLLAMPKTVHISMQLDVYTLIWFKLGMMILLNSKFQQSSIHITRTKMKVLMHVHPLVFSHFLFTLGQSMTDILCMLDKRL